MEDTGYRDTFTETEIGRIQDTEIQIQRQRQGGYRIQRYR